MSLVVIDDNTVVSPIVNGDIKARGLKPRDFGVHPVGCFAEAQPFPDDMLIPRDEWVDRLNAMKKNKSRLIDIRNRFLNGGPIPSRDQNGKGYCWAHSSTSAILLMRAAANEPYVDLSAYAVACIIKNYRDEGGFGAQSLKFIADRGIPSSQFWPQQSMSKANDNPQTWANAALHKYLEWYDLDPDHPKYFDQYVTCKLLNFATINDYSWWGHSVSGASLEDFGTGNIQTISFKDIIDWIWNSWGDGWSQHGMGQLKGSKVRPDACLAARVSTPSIAA